MKAYLLALLTVSATAANAQTNADSVETSKPNEALDSRYGFLGNKFETPLATYKGLVFVDNYKGYKVYKKPVEMKSFGKAHITSIRYSFYKGILAAVQVKASHTVENEDAWRALLKAAYGPAQDSVESKEPDDMKYNNYGGNYLWEGNKAFINFSARLGQTLSIYVSSTIVARRKEADDKAALKRAAQKL